MRVPIGIQCGKCNQEITQDMNGNMHCQCGVRYKWSHLAVGSGDKN